MSPKSESPELVNIPIPWNAMASLKHSYLLSVYHFLGFVFVGDCFFFSDWDPMGHHDSPPFGKLFLKHVPKRRSGANPRLRYKWLTGVKFSPLYKWSKKTSCITGTWRIIRWLVTRWWFQILVSAQGTFQCCSETDHAESLGGGLLQW